jgi:hypothetical protein
VPRGTTGGAYVLFQTLKATAVMKTVRGQAGGALAGFLMVFSFAFRVPAGSYDLRVKFGNRVLSQKVGGGTRDRQPVTVTAQAQTVQVEVQTG